MLLKVKGHLFQDSLLYVEGVSKDYFRLAKALAAGDVPEINTDKTDFNKRKTFREGL